RVRGDWRARPAERARERGSERRHAEQQRPPPAPAAPAELRFVVHPELADGGGIAPRGAVFHAQGVSKPPLLGSKREPDSQQRAAQLQFEVVAASEIVFEPDHAVARSTPKLRPPPQRTRP